MPLPLLAAAGISLGAKALSSLFGHHAQNAQNRENNRANTAALTLAQKQREDQRRARLAFGQGLLGRVPSTVGESASAGSEALSPELYAQLDQERKYNFAPTMASNAGGTSGFLAGLFNGASEVAPYLGGPAGAATGAGVSAAVPQGVQALDLDELRALGRTQHSSV